MKRLCKSKTDRKIFGVCGGIGEYANIDPTILRLALVLLVLFAGLSIWIYIIAAIVLPTEE